MLLRRVETKPIKKLAHIGMHEQCLLLKPLGMKSWNLERAAKAYKLLLKNVHKGECPKGYELLTHVVMADLGHDCIDVHEHALRGRWVKIGYTVYLKKK